MTMGDYCAMDVKDDYWEDAFENEGVLVEKNSVPQGNFLVNPNAVATPSQQDLLTLVTEVEKANYCINCSTLDKVELIAQQMTFLEKLKEELGIDEFIMEKSNKEWIRNIDLHNVRCNFVKQPGHLYKRHSEQRYFSMLSPKVYIDSYRMEWERTWTPASQLVAKNEELKRFWRPTSPKTLSYEQSHYVSNQHVMQPSEFVVLQPSCEKSVRWERGMLIKKDLAALPN